MRFQLHRLDLHGICMVFALSAASFLARGALAQTPATDITFDPSGTTAVTGTNVQAALESVDDVLTAIDPAATAVHLQTDCSATPNCFTTTAALTNWLWNGGRTLAPSAGDRVSVRMGPGDFDPFECLDAQGYVTVIGSGRESSRFVRSAPNEPNAFQGGPAGGIHATGCQDLEFGSLAAIGEDGVTWMDGGSARWWNVDMIGFRDVGIEQTSALISGWYDNQSNSQNPEVSEHFMFGVRIMAKGAAHGSLPAIVNIAALFVAVDVWIYGSDILATHAVAPAGSGELLFNHGVQTGGLPAIVRVFGGSVRSEVGAAKGATFSTGYGAPPIAAVRVFGDGASFHMHGGIIRADSSQSTTSPDTVGITADGVNTFVHTPGAAFTVLASGTGDRIRALNGATIQSPYLWPAGTTPPNVGEEEGSGIFVDTAAGTSGTESHMMVRDDDCSGPGGPWRDMVDGTCR